VAAWPDLRAIGNPRRFDLEEPDQARARGPADPDPPSRRRSGPTETQIADEICRDIVDIHRDSYGRAAESPKAHVLGDLVVVVLEGLELLPNEEFMIGNGQGDAVTALRRNFQRAIEPTFRAAVERATGRSVIGFASHVQVNEDPFAVEIFRLGHR
jgi:uncharacterized protein YbcI